MTEIAAQEAQGKQYDEAVLSAFLKCTAQDKEEFYGKTNRIFRLRTN